MGTRASGEAGRGPILPVSNTIHRVPVPAELQGAHDGPSSPTQPHHQRASRDYSGHQRASHDYTGHQRASYEPPDHQRPSYEHPDHHRASYEPPGRQRASHEHARSHTEKSPRGFGARFQRKAPRKSPRRSRRKSSLQSPKRYMNEATANYNSKDIRGHFVAMSGEFVGTMLFLFFAFAATQVANTRDPTGTNATSTLMYISASFGLSLLISVWVFYRISGGLFNPAVTFGLVISGQLPPLRGALLFFPQFFAGMVAAGLAEAMFPGPLVVLTTLSDGTSTAQGFFIEAFATAFLVITVLMLAAEKSKDTFIAPIGIGIALFVAELATVDFTGGSLNPTRSFGPCAVARQFPGYHWIYWFGPVFGAAMASGFYRFVKYFRYEEANPGQDAGDEVEFERESAAV